MGSVRSAICQRRLGRTIVGRPVVAVVGLRERRRKVSKSPIHPRDVREQILFEIPTKSRQEESDKAAAEQKYSLTGY